jgi:AcrR family transcriptional regulator
MDETRVEKRKRQTRERILKVALALFVEKGLDDTTVAEIADAADIGKGTFFTYFPSKAAVFADVTLGLAAAMEESLERATTAGQPFEARVAAFFRPALDWHAANPILSRSMLAAFLRDVAYVRADRASQHRFHARLSSALAEAQRAGAITADVELDAAVAAIAGTYFGCLGAWHAAETRTPLSADFLRALHVVCRGLRA